MAMLPRSRETCSLVAALLVVLATTAGAATESQQRIAERLRNAHAFVVAGDPATGEALSALERDEEARPVADVVAYLAARVHGATDPSVARDELAKLLDEHPASPLGTRIAADLAELMEPVSVERLRELVEKHASDAAPLDLDAARLLAAAGAKLRDTDAALAADWLMRARRRAPGSVPAKSAAATLKAMRGLSAELVPTSANAVLEEAQLTGREGSHDDQLRWLERFLERYPSDSRRGDALRSSGDAIAATKGRAAAAEYLERRARVERDRRVRAGLLFAAATHRWNLDDDATALARFEQVIATGAVTADPQRSHYSIGRIHEAAGRYAAAGTAYRRARTGPDASVAAESRWRAGWVAHLAGDFVAAADAFAGAASATHGDRTRDVHDSALYWQARSLERAGDSTSAERLYRALLDASPDSFYAYLAEKRTGLAARLPDPSALASRAPATDDVARRLARIAILNHAGFSDLASVEVSRVLEGASSEQQLQLLPSLAAAGAHGTALKIALELYGRGALTEPQLYAFLYPPAFAEMVQRETADKGLDPYLVYALMKQESLFDPHAVSPASAVGLMQLLPSTARRVAGVTDERELAAESLYDPSLNIRLGVAYLAELAKRFHNDPVFILASYNAGEKAADTWKQRFGSLDLDELVERITYRETRQYVKKILGNYRNYLRLYAGLRPLARGEQAE